MYTIKTFWLFNQSSHLPVPHGHCLIHKWTHTHTLTHAQTFGSSVSTTAFLGDCCHSDDLLPEVLRNVPIWHSVRRIIGLWISYKQFIIHLIICQISFVAASFELDQDVQNMNVLYSAMSVNQTYLAASVNPLIRLILWSLSGSHSFPMDTQAHRARGLEQRASQVPQGVSLFPWEKSARPEPEGTQPLYVF